MISAIENEERHPTVPLLIDLARALKVELYELIRFEH